jgi:hypothetical protein
MSESRESENSQAVPDWSQKTRPDLGTVLTLALGAAFLAYQFWLLPTLTDWPSSAAGEGYLSLAASRIRAGEWPYRDFFFAGTPGAPLLHSLLQGFGWTGERALSLLAATGSACFALSFGRAWKIPSTELALLAGLLVAWSFPLFNVSDSGWYAVFIGLFAIRALPRSEVLSAALFLLAFFFQPNVGICAALGAGASFYFSGEMRKCSRFLAVFCTGAIAIFAVIIYMGGSALEVFAFPPRFSAVRAAESFAAPLTLLGLWMLSLFFLRSGSGSRSSRLVQLGVVAYAGIYASRDLDSFIRCSFLLLSIAAWPISLALALTEKTRDSRFLALWLPGLGIFLLVLPGFDFRHFLFALPLTALLLAYSLSRVRVRYSWLPPLWARLPAVGLLLGGIYLQASVVNVRTEGTRDSLGRVSLGAPQRLNEEVIALWRYLTAQGLKAGDPVLVLPNAPGVYLWTGFRNPTPYLRFLPGSVEANKQSTVLPQYRSAGGRFLLLEERSGIETVAPELWRQIQAEYREVKSFPEHFTVYAPR